MGNNTLDELYDRVNNLYREVGQFQGKTTLYGAYLNETDIIVNDIYRNTIAEICKIHPDEVTYDMVELARGYTVTDESLGYRKYRHLNDEELRMQVGIIRGVPVEPSVVNDRIGKLYDMIEENISDIRKLGIPEDEVVSYMNDLTLDIFKNTISSITGINPEVIPNQFAYDISSCIKKEGNGIRTDRYTDSEIVLKAKEEGLYNKHVYIFPHEYNHALAGSVERLDHAIESHYEDLDNMGVKKDNIGTFMRNLTDDLYADTLSDVLEVPKEEITPEFIKKVRAGKTLVDGKTRSYFDNEVRLMYAYDKSANKTR